MAAVALARSAALEDGPALGELASALDIRFEGAAVRVDGEDLSERIRHDEVSVAASRVAAHPEVRAAILDQQRAMRRAPGLVADGRDMGTAVFPDAELKVFLDASAEIRAERRYRQLQEKGQPVDYAELLQNIRERDERDRTRSASPLVPAEDAVYLDSSDLSIDAVLERVLSLATDALP